MMYFMQLAIYHWYAVYTFLVFICCCHPLFHEPWLFIMLSLALDKMLLILPAVYPSGPPAAFFHPDQNPAMRPSRPPPPQEAAAFTATILPPAMPFHLPGGCTC